MRPLHPDPGSTTGAVMGMIFFAVTSPLRWRGFRARGQERNSYRNLIAVGPNRPCGRMARTMVPPRV